MTTNMGKHAIEAVHDPMCVGAGTAPDFHHKGVCDCLRVERIRSDERGEWAEEYVIVHDGDPYMDGTHERRETGRFTSLESAQRGLEIVGMRTPHAGDKPNLRIERRLVRAWEVVE